MEVAHNLPAGLFKTIVPERIFRLENIVDRVCVPLGRNKVSGPLLEIIHQQVQRREKTSLISEA